MNTKFPNPHQGFPNQGNPNYPQGYPPQGAMPPPGYPQGYPQIPPQGYPPGYPQSMPPQGYPPPRGPIPGYPQGYPQMPPQGYPQGYPQMPPPGYPQGYPQMPPQGYPPGYPQGMPPQGYPQTRAPISTNMSQGLFQQQNPNYPVSEPTEYSRFKDDPNQAKVVDSQTVNKGEVKMLKPKFYEIFPREISINSQLVINVLSEPITDNLIYEDEALLVCDCLEEAVEGIIESANNYPTKALYKRDAIITYDFYKARLQEEFENRYLAGDIKVLYKLVKNAYETIKSKYDYVAISWIDKHVTALINEFMAANSDVEISIDKFSEDFSELVRIVRNQDDIEMEDALLEMLNDEIANIKNTTKQYKEEIVEEKKATSTQLARKESIIYVDRLSSELGIDLIGEDYLRIKRNPGSSFIYSINDKFLLMFKGCYLVTLDRKIYRIVKNKVKDIVVKCVR